MDDATRRRLADNQAFYRDLNERIREVGYGFGGRDHPYEFVCECSRLSCDDRVRATLDEYEEVRAGPDRFLLVAGHEVPEIERVVARNDRFTTVEKIVAPSDERA